MKYLLMIIFTLLCTQALASNNQCNLKFTDEQTSLLKMAKAIGAPDNLGNTLAAIVIAESFVGPLIVRINPNDGKHGSYGVAHIQLSKAMELVGETNIWNAKATLVPKLMENDTFALSLALEILKQNKTRVDTYREVITAYNGGIGGLTNADALVYTANVVKKVQYLQSCPL